MAKSKKVRVQDLSGLLNQLYPTALAEDWDNVGLQLGDPATVVEKVLVCLDVEEEVIARAEEIGAQLVISHHPLIYQPLKRLTPTDAARRTLCRVMRGDIAVICAHTNLDRARDGMNDWLAERLGLQRTKPLEPSRRDLLKLVVFVPVGHEDAVLAALFAAGAGVVGNYDQVAFRSPGTGQFRCGAETSPHTGFPGSSEKVEELRIETILPAALSGKVVAGMLKAHPYEEVAFDLYPLVNQRNDVGLGRIGQLEAPQPLDVFIDQVKKALGVQQLRLAGACRTEVRKVAVCGGSGASLLSDALRQGVDCLVTGDVKYHDAQRARAEGLALLDAGHFGTEILMVEQVTQKLRRAAAERRWALEIIEMTGEEDPFSWV